MKCRICGKKSTTCFAAVILNKHNIKYYLCNHCGFLQTEEPFWLEESYADPINISDTGIMHRNIRLCKISSVLIYFLFDKNAAFLDYAGGYGILTRLMRDIGFDFYWHDPHATNLMARGFEGNKEKKFSLITAFEAFEHFVEPLKEVEKMLDISKNIIFTTQLLPKPVPEPKKWWYYGLEHGQHISFYGLKTLEYIAQKYNLNLYSFAGIHLLTSKKTNNTLYKSLIIASKMGLSLYVKANMKNRFFSDMDLTKKSKT